MHDQANKCFKIIKVFFLFILIFLLFSVNSDVPVFGKEDVSVIYFSSHYKLKINIRRIGEYSLVLTEKIEPASQITLRCKNILPMWFSCMILSNLTRTTSHSHQFCKSFECAETPFSFSLSSFIVKCAAGLSEKPNNFFTPVRNAYLPRE